MSYPIPHITREQFEGPADRGEPKCFPFVSGRWVSHTAEVVGIEIQKGKHTDYLIIKGRNGEYGVRLSVSLNPMFVPAFYSHDKDEQAAKNAERLVKVLKAFGLAEFDGGGAWLLPERFPDAIGRAFSFSIVGATEGGQPVFTDRGIQRTHAAFRGIANALLPVAVPIDAANEKPVATNALNSDNSPPEFDEDAA